MSISIKHIVALSVLLVTAFAQTATTAAAAQNQWTVVGSGRMDCVVLEGDVPHFRINGLTVGHNWIHPKLDGIPRVENGKRIFEQKGLGFYKGYWDKDPTGCRHDLRIEYTKSGDNSIGIEIKSRPDGDQQYGFPNDGVGFGFVLTKQPYFHGGTCRMDLADGKSRDLPYPLPRDSHAQVKTVVIKTAGGDETKFSFDPPLFVHSDNDEIRMFASPKEKTPAGGTMTQRITLTLPQAAAFEPDNRWVDTKDWIVYENKNDFTPGSVIGAEDWLDKPAGKHGWLKVDSDRLIFADGTPAKFWGVGIAWNRWMVSPEEADQWNDKLAKHGVNVVRIIPFFASDWKGFMTPDDHGLPLPDKMAQFDYHHASMKKRGIYVGWSPHYHVFVSPADRNRVLNYDEAVKGQGNDGLEYVLNIAPDLQDLMIARTVGFLKRTNAHTGLRYADDPAIAWMEFRNECDIFMPFDNYANIEKSYPNYFKRYQQRFCDYLQKKYGNQEAIEKAWGEVYPKGRSIASGDIRPNYPSWGIREKVDPYIADTMHFMYLEQSGFYQRYAKAIRETGYQGALNGSCWQAANWPGHLLNTLTDSEVGIIDRHNYAPTFLDNPGVGNFSVGFQQVKNRPFNFSEWGGGPIDVPTVAIYGMGLQGWDASCQFSSGKPFVFNKQARDCNVCCDDFIQIGQYPALARMVYRGDVKEGEIVANRQVSIPDLFQGKTGFLETFSLLGGANNKEFSSVVPSAALMAGRVLLEFVDGPTPEKPVIQNVDKYIDTKNGVVRSTTGQLLWDYKNRYYTVNTPGAQAVFGYVKGRQIALDDVAIAVVTDTSVKFYVAALDKGATIKTGKRLLVAAFGRDANTGMVFDEFDGDNSAGIKAGGEPLLLEPVQATLTLKGREVKSVLPLDHDGRLPQEVQSLPVKALGNGSSFTINGKQTRTMYYLVEMK